MKLNYFFPIISTRELQTNFQFVVLPLNPSKKWKKKVIFLCFFFYGYLVNIFTTWELKSSEIKQFRFKWNGQQATTLKFNFSQIISRRELKPLSNLLLSHSTLQKNGKKEEILLCSFLCSNLVNISTPQFKGNTWNNLLHHPEHFKL